MKLDTRKSFLAECPECLRPGCDVSSAKHGTVIKWKVWCDECGRNRLGIGATRAEALAALAVLRAQFHPHPPAPKTTEGA